jgi:hypothetical protein
LRLLQFDPRLLDGKSLRLEKGLVLDSKNEGKQQYSLEAASALQHAGMVLMTAKPGMSSLPSFSTTYAGFVHNATHSFKMNQSCLWYVCNSMAKPDSIACNVAGTAELVSRPELQPQHQLTVTRKYDVPPPGAGSYVKPVVTQPDNIRQRFPPFGAGEPGVLHICHEHRPFKGHLQAFVATFAVEHAY